jgi:hypothetical protein
MHDVRWMVTLGIEGGGKRKHVGGTKLHAEAAGLAALDDDGNTSFSHWISTLGAVEASPKPDVIMRGDGMVGCDRDHGYR